MTRIWVSIRSRFAGEDGASLMEYVLLAVLIAVVAVVAVTTVGQEVQASYDNSASHIANS